MKEFRLLNSDQIIDEKQVATTLKTWLESSPVKFQRVLLLPPDFTRFHSQAGLIVRLLYSMLAPTCHVDIMPALGTHVPMSESEKQKMFGTDIPADRFLDHDWRNGIIKIGTIPADYVAKVSGGLVDYPIDVEINRQIIEGKYDLVVSIGQVIPHEVAGMANFYKNIFVGCGGKDIINRSHFLGAAFGMERLMGQDHSPVHQIFDYAAEHFLKEVPLQFILTVTTTVKNHTQIEGLFIGRERKIFEDGVSLSQKCNLNLLDQPLSKVVVYLDPSEFKSLWLGNKSIYRTRMAIADGGELIVLAPGLERFGEDEDY